jgi:hypothetical protein
MASGPTKMFLSMVGMSRRLWNGCVSLRRALDKTVIAVFERWGHRFIDDAVGAFSGWMVKNWSSAILAMTSL